MISSPSPSVKIQITGNKAKHCWVISTNYLFLKVDNAEQWFAFTPQVNFSAHNLNFHWRCRDWIQATFRNIFYFTTLSWFRTLEYFSFNAQPPIQILNQLQSAWHYSISEWNYNKVNTSHIQFFLHFCQWTYSFTHSIYIRTVNSL